MVDGRGAHQDAHLQPVAPVGGFLQARDDRVLVAAVGEGRQRRYVHRFAGGGDVLADLVQEAAGAGPVGAGGVAPATGGLEQPVGGAGGGGAEPVSGGALPHRALQARRDLAQGLLDRVQVGCGCGVGGGRGGGGGQEGEAEGEGRGGDEGRRADGACQCGSLNWGVAPAGSVAGHTPTLINSRKLPRSSPLFTRLDRVPATPGRAVRGAAPVRCREGRSRSAEVDARGLQNREDAGSTPVGSARPDRPARAARAARAGRFGALRAVRRCGSRSCRGWRPRRAAARRWPGPRARTRR